MSASQSAESSLTPVQQELVSAPASDEIVAGGVAGSGKSLAAVYRAAQLCAQTPRTPNESAVLFLCYNRALAAAIRSLLAQLPPAISTRIEVRTAHRWCWEHGVRRFSQNAEVLAGDADQLALVREAIYAVHKHTGAHQVFDRDAHVFLDEIRLIKGGALFEQESYLGQRLQQPDALPEDDHALIFRVYHHYQQLLASSGRIDFDDFALISQKQRHQQRKPQRYAHVIVDEAQDLSSTQIALARDLARKSLLLVADQQQAIYRSTLLPGTLPDTYDFLLPTSLRMTVPIFSTASRLFPDTGMWSLPVRQGPTPYFRRFRWSDDEISFVSETVRDVLRRDYNPIDIAVLARRHDLLEPIHQQLAADGVPIASSAAGVGVEGVTVTTMYAAKGREFRIVIVVGLVEGVLPAVRPEMAPAAAMQELELSRRQLYVAMTRARDELWLTAAEGTPARFLRQMELIRFPQVTGTV